MDIIIKSFNRPYYLERCLRSIYLFAQGTFQIRVLDDGTAPEQLARLQTLFPAVAFHTSPRYADKVASLQAHVAGTRPFDQFTIPIGLWIEHVATSTDVFLLLEDDIWLTGPLDLDGYKLDMESNGLNMVKISWLGNPRVITGEKIVRSERVEEIIPAIPLVSQLVVLNKLGVRTALAKLRLLPLIRNDFDLQLPVYTLYGVTSAFFTKDYWLYLWDDSQQYPDEVQQLQRAGRWYASHKGRYAKSKVELTQTSFITSATRTYKGIKVDIHVFNHILNQAWQQGRLDAMENFPRDFSQRYLSQFLDDAHDERVSSGEWAKWIEKFKAQYTGFGCVVE